MMVQSRIVCDGNRPCKNATIDEYEKINYFLFLASREERGQLSKA
jgi:hypothetical protein